MILLEFFFDFVGNHSTKKLPEAFLKPLKRCRWTPDSKTSFQIIKLVIFSKKCLGKQNCPPPPPPPVLIGLQEVGENARIQFKQKFDLCKSFIQELLEKQSHQIKSYGRGPEDGAHEVTGSRGGLASLCARDGSNGDGVHPVNIRIETEIEFVADLLFSPKMESD